MRSERVKILASFSASFSKLSAPSVSMKKTRQFASSLNTGSDQIQMPWVQLETEGSTLNYIFRYIPLCRPVQASD
jgi:hypothetical protein